MSTHAASPVRRWLLVPALLLQLAVAACGSFSESGRKAQVLVPTDAEPVERVLWNDIRSTRALNERMVLFEGRHRPYLLVLSERCMGLNRESILVFDKERRAFSASTDSFGAIDTRFNMAPVSRCSPQTLYALRDDDVEWLERSLREKDRGDRGEPSASASAGAVHAAPG